MKYEGVRIYFGVMFIDLAVAAGEASRLMAEFSEASLGDESNFVIGSHTVRCRPDTAQWRLDATAVTAMQEIPCPPEAPDPTRYALRQDVRA